MDAPKELQIFTMASPKVATTQYLDYLLYDIIEGTYRTLQPAGVIKSIDEAVLTSKDLNIPERAQLVIAGRVLDPKEPVFFAVHDDKLKKFRMCFIIDTSVESVFFEMQVSIVTKGMFESTPYEDIYKTYIIYTKWAQDHYGSHGEKPKGVEVESGTTFAQGALKHTAADDVKVVERQGPSEGTEVVTAATMVYNEKFDEGKEVQIDRGNRRRFSRVVRQAVELATLVELGDAALSLHQLSNEVGATWESIKDKYSMVKEKAAQLFGVEFGSEYSETAKIFALTTYSWASLESVMNFVRDAQTVDLGAKECRRLIVIRYKSLVNSQIPFSTTKRFPATGLYVNLDSVLLLKQMIVLLTSLNALTTENLTLETRKAYYTALAAYETELSSPATGSVFDRKLFEEHFGLTWK
ncbi:hypothetical protein [Streptococcus anginosus]